MAKKRGQTADPPQTYIEDDGETVGPVVVNDLNNQITRIVDARRDIESARDELNDAKQAALAIMHDEGLESYETTVEGVIYRIKRDASEKLLLAKVKGEPA